MLISQAFTNYRQYEIAMGGLSPMTDLSYANCQRLSINYFGNIKLKQLTLDSIKSFLEYMLSWQKPDSARSNLICFRSVLRYAERHGERVISADDIKIPKREKRVMLFLTEVEQAEFVEAVAKPSRGYKTENPFA